MEKTLKENEREMALSPETKNILNMKMVVDEVYNQMLTIKDQYVTPEELDDYGRELIDHISEIQKALDALMVCSINLKLMEVDNLQSKVVEV